MKPIARNVSAVAGLIFLCLAVTGCPDKITPMPEISVDYGLYPTDTNPPRDVKTDVSNTDTDVHDTRTADITDNGTSDNLIVDTGPCTLLCPAYVKCGPHPCGVGKCEPGCDKDETCDLTTRTCIKDECQPNCGNKECGYDGCGGTCPPGCPDGEHCNYTDGTCGTQCYVDCEGKLCGDNGCGGTCSPGCPGEVECHADGYCINEGQCLASSTELKCDADGNSCRGSTAWSIGTTTTALFNYSETCGSSYNPGPEKAFKLVVPVDVTGALEVEISQSLPLLADFLNVYLIEDTGNGCTAANCVAWGDSTKSFQYEVPSSPTGHTYYLIADSSSRNDGTFSITIKKCAWNEFDDDAPVTADN